MSTHTPVRRALLAVLLLAGLVLASCGDDDSGGPDRAATDGEVSEEGPRGTLRVAAYLSPPNLDPHEMALGQPIQLSQPVYDTLVRKLPDGTFVPMLATEWGYVDDDPTLFEMQLRDDVDFIDGTHFDAHAVKANIERFKAKPPGLNSMVEDIAEVEVVDDDTVRFHLSTPMPQILLTLSTNPAGAMLSPEAFDNADLGTNPVGSGPYTFDRGSFVDGSFYAFDVREGYWDPSLQRLERIEFTVFAEVEARYNAIAAGQVDMAPADITYVEDAETEGLDVVRNPVDWWGLILFDRDGTIAPPLADVRVRQAMNHAVDREAILETVALGAGHVTTQIYPQNSPAYVDDLDDRYSYDPERARELLAEAGYPDGFSFDTPAIADSTYLEALAGYLADVGIDMNLNVVDGNAYVDAVVSGNYPAAYFTFGSEFPSQDNATLVMPGGSLNILNTTDQEVIDLDTRAAAASGGEQVELWQDINEKITEEAWFLITHAADSILLVQPNVTGTTPYVNQDSLSIYEWGIEE